MQPSHVNVSSDLYIAVRYYTENATPRNPICKAIRFFRELMFAWPSILRSSTYSSPSTILFFPSFVDRFPIEPGCRSVGSVGRTRYAVGEEDSVWKWKRWRKVSGNFDAVDWTANPAQDVDGSKRRNLWMPRRKEGATVLQWYQVLAVWSGSTFFLSLLPSFLFHYFIKLSLGMLLKLTIRLEWSCW